MLDSWHLESRNLQEEEEDDEIVLTKFCLDQSDMPENPDDQTQVSQLPKWSYLQWADDIAQMQSSFPNLGYFHLWCLPWEGIIRIAVRVGRRQKLYRFLRHSEFGINNQFVCARRDEHRSGSSESNPVLSSFRFWIQALAPEIFQSVWNLVQFKIRFSFNYIASD